MSEKPLVSAEEMASVLSADGDDASGAQRFAGIAGDGSYSLRAPLALPPGDESAARAQADELCASLASALSRELDLEIQIEIDGFGQQQARDAMTVVPGPNWVLGFQADRGGGLALLVEPGCALAFVELALGGPGSSECAPREPTPLEARVMTNLARAVRSSLPRLGGSGFVDSRFSVDRIPPELAAEGETVVVALLKIRLHGKDRPGMLVTTASLFKAPETQPVETGELGPLAPLLDDVRVEARPVLRAGRVSLRDLVHIVPGKVLRLSADRDTPIDLRIAERRFFSGKVTRGEGGASFEATDRRAPASSNARALTTTEPASAGSTKENP